MTRTAGSDETLERMQVYVIVRSVYLARTASSHGNSGIENYEECAIPHARPKTSDGTFSLAYIMLMGIPVLHGYSRSQVLLSTTLDDVGRCGFHSTSYLLVVGTSPVIGI